MDATYIRVIGKWCCLWRSIDANGQTIDFRPTGQRDAKVAKAFLNKPVERAALHRPVIMVTDKAPTHRRVIREINRRHELHFESIRHVDRKWRNTVIESDHAAMKTALGLPPELSILAISQSDIKRD